jgi:hypothetical protein
MSGKIIAHIVGLPNNYKKNFIEDFKQFNNNKNISIVDLDDITMQIIAEKNIILLYSKLDELAEKKTKKSLETKTVNRSIKEIENKINEYWKSKIDNYLLKEINKNNSIICIGQSTYFKNHKIGIKIITSNKLFIKLNLFENARTIIADNLDTHREDIIKGTFDLNYLNINHLVRKREDLQNIYENMGYQLKSYNDICKIIQISLYNINQVEGLFFVDTKLHTKAQLKKKKNINAYTSDWLAIISILKDGITKGYKNKKPFIEEIVPNTIEKLKDPIYIYYTTDTDCFMPEITKSAQIYKYISTRAINNFTNLKLDNPLDKLRKMKIKIMELN